MGKGSKTMAKHTYKRHDHNPQNKSLHELFCKAMDMGMDYSFNPPNKKKTGKLTKKEVIAKIKKERKEKESKKWETCFKCGGMKNYDGEMFKKCEGCCDECGSSDICSKWKHKDKLCVNCCECDDCIEECIEDGYEPPYEIYFNDGEEVVGYDTKEQMKEMFDLYVKDLSEYGYITFETPIKRPTAMCCYGDDEAEDWMWEECDRCGYEDVLICMSNGCINEY